MTYVCENCGHVDSAIWKPMLWASQKYGSYADFQDFKKEKPTLAAQLKKKGDKTDDQYFTYQRKGKTRDVVHRFPKAFESMRHTQLYEKTPNEKHEDLFQTKLAPKNRMITLSDRDMQIVETLK